MSDTKVIRNSSGVAQSVVFQGRQITLQAHAEERMDSDLADIFIGRCHPIVVEVVSAIEDVYDPDGGDTVWIANVTGNPSYPSHVDSKSLQAKKWVYSKIENPASKPFPVTRSYDPGQQAYVGRDGAYMTKNLAPMPLTIAPFQRKSFKRDVADWYLRREGNSCRLSGFSPAVIRSRKPTAYEPDMEWSLDEMRAYLQVISSGKAPIGLSEAELAAEVTAKKLPREEAYNLLQLAKRTVKDASWFYVVNPAYRAPTRSEIRELLTGKSNAEIHDAQLDKLMGTSTGAAA